jgi:hypothetical protein
MAGTWERRDLPTNYLLPKLGAHSLDLVGYVEQFNSDRNLKYTDLGGSFAYFPIVGEMTNLLDGIYVTLLIDSDRWNLLPRQIESDGRSIDFDSVEILGASAQNPRLIEVRAVIPYGDFPEFDVVKWTIEFDEMSMSIQQAPNWSVFLIARAMVKLDNRGCVTAFPLKNAEIERALGLSTFKFELIDSRPWEFLRGGKLLHSLSAAIFKPLEYRIDIDNGQNGLISMQLNLKIRVSNILMRGIDAGDLSPIDGRPTPRAKRIVEFEYSEMVDRQTLPPTFHRSFFPEERPRDRYEDITYYDNRGSHILDRVLVSSYNPKYKPSIPEIETQCQGCRNYHGQSWGGNRLVCGIYPMGNESQCSDFESKPDELARP